MKFTTIYRIGKPQYFFIKLDSSNEFAFIQPYFIATSIDKPRFDNILEMECLFSNSVWYGRQKHGYGYSCSADVFESLVKAINKLHKGKLTDKAHQELGAINSHDDTLHLSEALLSELDALNSAALEDKYSH